jgi:hypothetical protein
MTYSAVATRSRENAYRYLNKRDDLARIHALQKMARTSSDASVKPSAICLEMGTENGVDLKAGLAGQTATDE